MPAALRSVRLRPALGALSTGLRRDKSAFLGEPLPSALLRTASINQPRNASACPELVEGSQALHPPSPPRLRLRRSSS